MEALLIITKLFVTSILTTIVLYIVFVTIKQSIKLSFEIKDELILVVLLLLFLATPILFFVIDGYWLSPYIIGKYIRELIISILVAAPIVLGVYIYKIIPKMLLFVNSKNLSLKESLGNKLLIAWDKNLINDNDIREDKVIHSLRRWIQQKNDAGWYELKEQIDENGLSSSQAIWMVSKELSGLQQKKLQGIVLERSHDYEEKLKSLLPNSTGEVCKDWDNHLATKEMAYDAMEIYAFKKWVWQNDETGWIHLQCIFDDRKRFSQTTVDFAELELWELEKNKKKGKSRDAKKEARLMSLLT